MNEPAQGTRSPRQRWGARLAVVAAAAGAFTAPTGAASAATHSTSYFDGELRTVTSEPCLDGALIELRMRWHGTVRWTDHDDDGRVDQLKLDLRAEVEMRSLDPGTPSYAGRLGSSLSRTTNGKAYTQTLVVRSSLRGDDRSHLAVRTVSHITSDANGNVTAQLERPRC